ncbi:polynucleotide kinase-phosphatase [Fibrella forsythiae]|uniref:Polynucleotide kinase-phosphatase n=1 Tax=Fibrella forsythiae TaxID=2817061 RepID=A0ABS3JTG3_9BACT|nr:polynucleotide kinase-phosphatase [Fibrella forsythiae]MBO0952738.1 polynucleotide kinase-phosphatase [Fibrella forsythiae]
MTLDIPDMSLVVLIGPTSSGKSTFARQHFSPTEIISSDQCRGYVSDDDSDQSATGDAFELLHHWASLRLKRGRVTVIDATNVQQHARKQLIELAREHHVLPVAIVFNLPESVLKARHEQRTDRSFGDHVIGSHQRELRRSLKFLAKEGFRNVYVFNSPEEVAAVTGLQRTRLWNNRTDEHGPFDIIGDVHGCLTELHELLTKLGYVMKKDDAGINRVTHPEGRKALFVGDLIDRGPDSVSVLKLVMQMVADQTGLCVPGNHDAKLGKYLAGKKVQLTHGLAETVKQLEAEPIEFRQSVNAFIYKLVSHFVLDDGKLVVAHAGLKESMQGRGSGTVRSFCLYGDTTGEIDEFGLPVRLDWATNYKGKAMVVYGHTPFPEAEWVNNTIDIDTGCVFGGKLTALRYPERELVSVPAHQLYSEPSRPFLTGTSIVGELPISVEHQPDTLPRRAAQHQADDVLDMSDVLGKRVIQPRIGPLVTIREENAIAALEIMSRFAVNPKWLLYLPPTMSPSETSTLPGYLEHPAEAFAYYRNQGITKVVCEEKHMGSRAVVIVCREATVAQTRFGLADSAEGVVYTRTGRRFFLKLEIETAFLQKVNRALTATNFWADHNTDWVALDCELMPWSAKATDLIRHQYAAVGTSGLNALTAAQEALKQAALNDQAVASLQSQTIERLSNIQKYRTAYATYCHEVDGLEGLVLAPFHVLATEGNVYANRPHTWHMETIATLCAADPGFLLATPYHVVDLNNGASVEAVTDWWVRLTAAGGEGMVVKPFDFIAKTDKGKLIQPAIKCRGSEYLRIIYGPDYDTPDYLTELRQRGLTTKRTMALREFTLGLEAMERFIDREPLRRTHECVFGVLALESEPVDPRL